MVTAPPPTGTDGPITLINTFTMPFDEAEHLLVRWRDTAAAMAHCTGFRSADVYHAVEHGDELRIVTVEQWDDENCLRSAQEDAQVQEAIGRMVGDPGLHVTQHPAIYQVTEHIAPDQP